MGVRLSLPEFPSTVEVTGDVPIYFTSGEMDGLLAALDQAVSEGRPSLRTAEGLTLVHQYSWEKTAQGVLQVLSSLG